MCSFYWRALGKGMRQARLCIPFPSLVCCKTRINKLSCFRKCGCFWLFFMCLLLFVLFFLSLTLLLLVFLLFLSFFMSMSFSLLLVLPFFIAIVVVVVWSKFFSFWTMTLINCYNFAAIRSPRAELTKLAANPVCRPVWKDGLLSNLQRR